MWFVKPKHADFYFLYVYLTRSKSVSPVCIEAEMQVCNKGLDLQNQNISEASKQQVSLHAFFFHTINI